MISSDSRARRVTSPLRGVTCACSAAADGRVPPGGLPIHPLPTVSRSPASKLRGGHPLAALGRLAARMLSAVVLAGVLAAAGCGDPPATNTSGPVEGNTANFVTAPAGASDVQGFSELNIAFALPKSLRIAARSPEDHELRLASRPGLSTAVTGRMALVSREGKSQALTDAMSAIVDHWNSTRRNENLASHSEAQPHIVENFHPPGDQNLTIVKMQMQVTKPLPAAPGSDPGEMHQAEVLAVGYFVVLQTIKPAAAGRPEQTIQQSIVAVFILEAAPVAEAALDAMIKSIRGMEK